MGQDRLCNLSRMAIEYDIVLRIGFYRYCKRFLFMQIQEENILSVCILVITFSCYYLINLLTVYFLLYISVCH